MNRYRKHSSLLLGVVVTVLMLFMPPGLRAAEVNLDIEEFILPNGMQFIVVERPTVGQVACRVAIRAGSALEETGKTGIAHMLEHMLFKGTKNFGTRDWEKDQVLQAQIEAAYQTIRMETAKRQPNQEVITAKQTQMDRLRRQVQEIYVPQAFSSQLGKNGAVGVNAFTSKDQTQYVMALPADMMEQWFAIVSEQLFEPAWREFYVEKEVVQREWAYRYVNNPNGAAWLDLEATAYTAHPYRNPVIGWQADMAQFNTTDARAFHARYYTPANAVAVLVGDISVTRARELAKIYFARYPQGSRAPETVTAEPAQQGPRRSVRYLKGARTPLVRMGYHGAAMGTDDFYALDVLTMLLSQGQAARLDQHLVNAGRAVNAWAYNPDARYGSLVVLGGSPVDPPDLNDAELTEEQRRAIYLNACEELAELLRKEIETLKNQMVTPDELARIKTLNELEFLERIRDNERLASTLATLEVQIGWGYLKDYLERIAAVTPEMVMDVAQRYFRTANETTVFVIPGGTPDTPPAPYQEQRALSATSAAPQARPATWTNHSRYLTPEGWKHPLSFDRQPRRIHYPPAEQLQINGATLFFLPDPQVPLVDITLLFKAGEVDLASGQAGLATLLAEGLLRGGTADFTPRELGAHLDAEGIDLSVDIGLEASTIQMTVLKGKLEQGLATLAAILTTPRFDSEVLAAIKAQMQAGLKRQGGDAQSVAMDEVIQRRFPDHPYGRDPLQGLTTIPTLETTDLTAFLNAYLTTANLVVAVAGDLTPPEVEQHLAPFLNRLPATPPPARELAAPDPADPALVFIHKPGQVQSQVGFTLPGIPRQHPDYWSLALAAQIFGGNDSILYKRLRDDLGLVYSAWAGQTYRWQAGFIIGGMGCKGDQTVRAVKETAGLMAALQAEIPSDAFTLRQLDVLNSFVFNVDSPASLTEVYGRYFMRQEPLDTLDQIQTAYLTATPAKLQPLARQYFDPGNLQIVVVGDGDLKVRSQAEEAMDLRTALDQLAAQIGLPFEEAPLR